MRQSRPAGGERSIPRTIWALWLQGWEEAPEIVRACRATWESLNPGWSFRPLTRASLSALLGPDALRCVSGARELPPEALSDVVRIALLKRYGGVWADSTTYCLRPLDAWLPGATTSGFFAFAKPGPDRMISSWFLAAAPGNPQPGDAFQDSISGYYGPGVQRNHLAANQFDDRANCQQRESRHCEGRNHPHHSPAAIEPGDARCDHQEDDNKNIKGLFEESSTRSSLESSPMKISA